MAGRAAEHPDIVGRLAGGDRVSWDDCHRDRGVKVSDAELEVDHAL